MVEESTTQYSLPGKLEIMLSTLSAYYEKNGRASLNRIIVNSKYSIELDTEYDGWDGGQHGHTLRLYLPKPLYLEVIDKQSDISVSIRTDINKIAHCPHEYIADVILEHEETALITDWRAESKDKLPIKKHVAAVSDDALAKLWHPGFLRLFISHKAECKKEVASLKHCCDTYGISCFVAHEDIEPTSEWQREIERALASMEVMVLWLSDNFHDSNWTDQEAGVAIGRDVFIIPIKVGKDPYGFTGKYQALNGTGKSASILSQEILSILLRNPAYSDRMIEALSYRFEQAETFVQANRIFAILNRAERASHDVIERMDRAFRYNRQVGEAFDVQTGLPTLITRLKSARR